MNRNRDKQFNIRLTAKELDMFERKRKSSGMNKTDFFMKLVRGSNIFPMTRSFGWQKKHRK